MGCYKTYYQLIAIQSTMFHDEKKNIRLDRGLIIIFPLKMVKALANLVTIMEGSSLETLDSRELVDPTDNAWCSRAKALVKNGVCNCKSRRIKALWVTRKTHRCMRTLTKLNKRDQDEKKSKGSYE